MTEPQAAPLVEWQGDDVVVAGRWTYAWGDRRRPHVHPLTTPAGHVLSRNAPDDHPWHHALWFTIKFVNDENFWEEYDAYGVPHHDGRPAVVDHGGGSVSLRGRLDWIRPDRSTVALTEHRTWTHVPLGADAYAIDLDTRLVPATDVRLDRTEFTTWGGYGGLTLRGPGDWHDTVLTLADGSSHQRLEGVPSRWCDLTGTVGASGDGAVAGVALLDHPGNRRHPVPFYASTRNANYGDEGWSNFFNAAFLWDDGLDLASGEELRVRHRTVVHDGTWSVDQMDAAWQGWAHGD